MYSVTCISDNNFVGTEIFFIFPSSNLHPFATLIDHQKNNTFESYKNGSIIFNKLFLSNIESA